MLYDFHIQSTIVYSKCINKSTHYKTIIVENISSRLKKYITFRNVSIRSFEKSLKWGNSTVNNLKNSISTDKLLELKDTYPDLNLGWCLNYYSVMILT